MSADNVTPIRPGAAVAPTPPVKKRKGRGAHAGPTVAQVLAVVDRQQLSLLNLVHVVRCIEHYTMEHCDEIVGAVQLVKGELERIAEALEADMIKLAARESRPGERPA